MARLYRQTDEQSRKLGWIEAAHPDELEPTKSALVDAIAKGRPLAREQRIRIADGTYRWFVVRYVPRHDEDGDIMSWYGSAMDVHDLTRA